jgi:NAD+ synthase
MKYDNCMKLTLALAQINPTVGDLAGNAMMIVRAAQEAAQAGADLVLYPEMALTGYPPEDLVLVPAFRQAAWDAARQIARETETLPCDLIFGNLWEEGEAIYNASVLASGGRLSLLRAKHALPNYGVFDEKRVFAPGPVPSIVEWRGIKLGLLICEEVWQPGAAKALADAGAELLLVQNASPYHIGKAGQRKAVVDAAVQATGLPLVYLNLVGGQDELVFDGRSYVVDAADHDVVRLPAFREALAITEWTRAEAGWQCAPQPLTPPRPDEETIYAALVLGLRDYVRKNGFPGVVLGLSGGIDSALTAAIAADALGPQKVLGLRLPSPYSSTDSLEDATQLAERLGVALHTVPIAPGMEAMGGVLGELFAGRASDTTEENIQARLRGLVLMAVSNKFGHMLLTTGNKSEMSVGYATLYGDMAGGFSVLKDVYKTTVSKLSIWRNGCSADDMARLGFAGAAGAVIPERSITKPPSAELRPDQKDEDSLPPYALLDTILRGLIERQLSVRELIAEGLDAAVVEKVAKLVWAAEYKRRQSAPGVKITPMAFGRDRRWPITNRWKFQ